jgi:hypothetical protein
VNILTKPLADITFDDVEQFCKTQVIEGVNLEYKQEFPRDLAKQFVTFSNTEGGLIIIGVAEDERTGLPISSEGIATEGKPLDRVYQFAANVIPYPTFDARLTDEKNGKTFVLIRVLEGSAPPYSTNNDPTPWVRTGNVSKPLVPANREDLLRLMGKRDKAAELRRTNLTFARSIFEQDLMESSTATPSSSGQSAAFEISIMPYYPERNILSYGELEPIAPLLGAHWQGTAYTSGDVSIPQGRSAFRRADYKDVFTSDQLYLTGHIYRSTSITHMNGNEVEEVSPYAIGGHLNKQLTMAAHVYKHANYHGLVVINVKIHGAKGVYTFPIDSTPFRSDETAQIKLNEYEWSETTDTSTLSEPAATGELHETLQRQIMWDLGIGNTSTSIFEWYFGQNNWYGYDDRDS